MDSFTGIYRGKRVLVTGHSGFKGSWLSEWLLSLGADVTGFSLEPDAEPALFDQLGLRSRLHHTVGDVRDAICVSEVVEAVKPDFIFHLAAQSLVRRSYAQPVETYAINIMGTVHVLDAARTLGSPCSIVVVTTDKCYENKEWLQGYRETDPMGGHDPYSSSKGATELVVQGYRRSFFSSPDSKVRVATARAGNVIGGGDWAADRIVPDCIRALQQRQAIPVRNKVSTRPWQHVLEPLSGYLQLGAALHATTLNPQLSTLNYLCSGFNFGPSLTSNRTVAELVQEILKHWPGNWEDRSDPLAVHEAKLLNLATDKAFHLLGWQPVWNFEESISRTVEWYRQTAGDIGAAASLLTRQIADYEAAAKRLGIVWAKEEDSKD